MNAKRKYRMDMIKYGDAPCRPTDQQGDISEFPVYLHTYKIVDEDCDRTFIFRFPSQEESPTEAFERFRFINEDKILEILAEDHFKCLGASVQHVLTEYSTLADYFNDDELKVEASEVESESDDCYFDLMVDEWSLNEIPY
jgi:hypothetical protein